MYQTLMGSADRSAFVMRWSDSWAPVREALQAYQGARREALAAILLPASRESSIPASVALAAEGCGQA